MTAACTHCGAPLRLEGVAKRQLECDYCHHQTILPDHIWNAIKPKTRVQQAPQVVIDMSNLPGSKTASRIGSFVGITVLLSVVAGIALPIYLHKQAQDRVNKAIASSGVPAGRRGTGRAEKPVAPPTKVAKPKNIVTTTITSFPDGAKVYINARAMGITPFEWRMQESPDTFVIKLTKEGFEPKIAKVVPSEDAKLMLELSRKKQRPTGQN